VPAYAELNGSEAAWVRPTSPMAVFGAGDAHEMISFSGVVSTADEPDDGDFPITAILGSLRYHQGSATRTSASERIRDVDPLENAIISMTDAEKLKLSDGDIVKIESRWGQIKRRIGRSNRIAAGQLFVPLAVNANDAMNLIDLKDLADPSTTGWKTCAVRIEKV
jgi:anaerobic selenocysteine-containing dehydrogenase